MRLSWGVLWQKDFPVFALLVVISVALMAAGRVAGVSAVADALGRIFVPFEMLSSKLASAAFIYEDNRALRGKLVEVSRENMMLKEQVYEVERLRRLVGFRDAVAAPLKACRVVAEIDRRLGGGVMIDAGYDQGLARNMTVISPDGMVGLVVGTGAGVATVKRIIDPGSRVSACLQLTRATGILRARSDGGLFMDWVAPNADVQPGDTVISSGLGSVVPKGILVGEVKNVFEDPDKFSLSLQISPFADFGRLEEVFVLMARPSPSIDPEDIGSPEVAR